MSAACRTRHRPADHRADGQLHRQRRHQGVHLHRRPRLDRGEKRRHARPAQGRHAQRPPAPRANSSSTSTASASSHHDTKVQNFFDEAEIKRVYYPEMEALIKAESGAKRVVVFDHTLRTADDALREKQKIREVVRRAHNDYTEWSGPQRRARHPAGRGRRAAQAPLRHHPGVAADPPSGRDPSARHLPTPAASRSDDFVISERRYPEPHRPDLRHRLQPEAQVVLVPAPGARRGAGVQGLRLGEGRPRPLDRAHRLRRPDHAAERAAAREHRNPHAGVFLSRCYQSRGYDAVPSRPRSKHEDAMPEADKEGERYQADTPQAAPGFFLKGSPPARLGHEEPPRAHLQSAVRPHRHAGHRPRLLPGPDHRA